MLKRLFAEIADFFAPPKEPEGPVGTIIAVHSDNIIIQQERRGNTILIYMDNTSGYKVGQTVDITVYVIE